MTEWLTEAEQSTWRAVLRMHANLMTAMAQGLRADSDMSMSDYEVLALLSEAPDAELRARDLRYELQWEKSRLAHQLQQMEERGLVQRETAVEDGLAPMIGLSETGRAAIDAAAPAHVARVRELFFDVLSAEQVRALGDAASAVLENVGGFADDPDEDGRTDLRS